jgi:hypothetical protein
MKLPESYKEAKRCIVCAFRNSNGIHYWCEHPSVFIKGDVPLEYIVDPDHGSCNLFEKSKRVQTHRR